jgi:Fe-S cluster biosynthesis and repair protein YggX
MWLDHQTMLINENNLNLFDESSQSYLKEQMENYFFSEQDIDQIKGYVPK